MLNLSIAKLSQRLCNFETHLKKSNMHRLRSGTYESVQLHLNYLKFLNIFIAIFPDFNPLMSLATSFDQFGWNFQKLIAMVNLEFLFLTFFEFFFVIKIVKF